MVTSWRSMAKAGDVGAQRRMLVVPAELVGAALRRRAWRSRRDLHPLARRRHAFDARPIAGRLSLLLERQPMPHVEQRLLVHHLVLEDREDRLRAIEQRMARLIDIRVQDRVDHLTIRFVGKGANLVASRPAIVPSCLSCPSAARPLAPTVVSCGSIPRANSVSSRASMLGRPRPFLTQRVEAEARQVPFVEDDRMAQRDRPAVVGLFGQQIEDFARARAIPPIPCRGGRAVESHPCILIRNRLK